MRDPRLAASVGEWTTSVPRAVRDDAMWEMEAYRLGLYVCDNAWDDVTALGEDTRTRSLADQLYRSLGSISANIAEGYSRGGGRDRARFLEYALDSERVQSQIDVLTSIIRLLLVMVKDQRTVHLREPEVSYLTGASDNSDAGSV